NQELVVSVQDTGLGIAKDELLKVFDKFYQTGERVATDVSGTGIGLSIAKEIVQLHGGKIWAESQDAQGAKFSFTVLLNLN
ncbi:MAG: ATP-binding protein, partial [Candidatus Omnitrophota bacterium]|nr:ATP-binding protein [Candidatus Omnitrophota bacterium]